MSYFYTSMKRILIESCTKVNKKWPNTGVRRGLSIDATTLMLSAGEMNIMLKIYRRDK